MKMTFVKISGISLALFAVLFAVWGLKITNSSAAGVTVDSSILVAVCGNGNVEGPVEECDDGKQCASREACTDDIECLGIGDEICKVRAGDGCNITCQIEVGGGRGEPTAITLTEITAFPEQRTGTLGTNYDTDYYFRILDPNDLTHTIVYQDNNILSTNNAGLGLLSIEIPIGEGLYDASFKSEQHLTKILDSVFMQIGDNYLNFTNSQNLTSIGPVRLIAGDIDGIGSTVSTMGDDVINAVDLSILLDRIGNSDPSGNGQRANLNQDNVVDELDLNILLSNLDKEGDK